MNDDCLFCRIVSGDLPATRILETETVIAFLDVGPIIHGHTLVIPKAHHNTLTDLPPDVLADVMQNVQRVARAQTQALNATGTNIMQNNGASAGQSVLHIHFHVIPRFDADGHHWNWKPGRYDDSNERDRLADSIKRELESD